MKTRTSEYTLVLPTGEIMPLTSQHMFEYRVGIIKKPNYETGFYEFIRTGYNKIILTLPDNSQQEYGCTACDIQDDVITPTYNDLALALYSEF